MYLFWVTAFIRMILDGRLPVCFLELILRACFGYPKNLIVFSVITLTWAASKHCEIYMYMCVCVCMYKLFCREMNSLPSPCFFFGCKDVSNRLALQRQTLLSGSLCLSRCLTLGVCLCLCLSHRGKKGC